MTSLSHRIIGDGQPCTFVHGFTQTGQSWVPLLHHMSVPIRATLVDAPDHGKTSSSLTLDDTAHVIRDLAEQQTLIGYSMGARMSLVAACTFPTAFSRLVLISGTAGLDSDAERTLRIAADNDLATRVEQIGVPAFIAEWLALPMFSRLTTEAAQIDQRLTNTATRLASSLRKAGAGTQTPLWDILPDLAIPVLLIAGQNDPKFSAIAERMHALLPSSTLHIHPGAGHTVHLEDPKGCAEVISEWLLRTER